MKLSSTKTLVTIGLLIALQIVLSRFLSINAWNIKFGFGFVPVAMAAIFYGPIGGALVGGVADILGAILFPSGPFFPGFTLTSILMGIVLGVFLQKKQTTFRILSAVIINQIVFSLGLNSFWLCVLYHSSFKAVFLPRIIQIIAVIPVEIATITFLSKGLVFYRKRLFV